MADEFDWDDDDDGLTQLANDQNSGKTPKGLRAYAKKIDEENRALRARLEGLEKDTRTRRVADAVKAKGLDPGVAGIVPDGVASDDAALEKWLTDNGKFFAKQATEGEATVSEGFPDETLVEDAAGVMRLSQISQGAIPVSREAGLMAQIKAVKTREELNEIMRQNGNPFVG